MAITTQSGKVLPGPSMGKALVDGLEKGKHKEKEAVVTSIPKPPPLFPHRLKKKANDTKFRKFMAMLKKLMINLPLVKALEQMPECSKFMKDLVMKKHTVIYEPMNNLHYYSAISTQFLVQKKVDPRAFTIPYTIGSIDFAKALCDLGASINLMLLAMYKKLGLGDPIPTNIRIVMKERSVKQSIGILHDVLVKVADFIFLADFAILSNWESISWPGVE
ncbi:uncharacterized protein LOC107865350 [Capsicum annuum]|uniref:uncharacterized protein LOC107865350 n=1 Tax=Capsicum annuum TaxID=4072 RepID=UPI001FB0A04B|nr:uncharacterized protein LOC107865350 [Capsicum annuum]